jgi:hypothetical protein
MVAAPLLHLAPAEAPTAAEVSRNTAALAHRDRTTPRERGREKSGDR